MRFRNVLACLAGLLCERIAAEDVTFFHVSSFAYDLGIVVTKEEFKEQRLLGRLQRFASLQATRHRLSRLTVSSREIDLRFALPGLSIMYENPNIFNGPWNRRHSIAQVVCLNGVASAFIKDGDLVKHVQFSGDRDPRDFTVDGQTVRLVSFDIHSDSNSLNDLTSQSRDEWIGIDVEAKPLLTIAGGEHLLAKLSAALGTDAVDLVVRSDSLFGLIGGPPFDVLHPPFPDVTKEAYLAIPYMNCTAWPKFRQGARREAGGTCRVVRPNQLDRPLVGRDTP